MNLQATIRDLSKELNYLYLTATPPDDDRIEKIVNALDDLSIEALKQTLDENTKDFKTVIKTLTSATQAAETAVNDLSRTADAIAGAVQAVKVLDKLLDYAGSFIG